ncbi:g8259 [Coccomyxa elongata]
MKDTLHDKLFLSDGKLTDSPRGVELRSKASGPDFVASTSTGRNGQKSGVFSSDLSRVSLGLGTVKRAITRRSTSEQELTKWDEGRALLRPQPSLSRPDSEAELDSLAQDEDEQEAPLRMPENGMGAFTYHESHHGRPPPETHAHPAMDGYSSSSSAGPLAVEPVERRMQNAPLLNIPTPFAAVSDQQGHAYRGSRPLSVLPDSHIPLPSIAEVDMTPRRSFLDTRSNSLPESPVSARAANALRASLGCSPDTPLKGRPPGTRFFSDDTARQFQPGESNTLDEAQRLPMRHSRSMPSVPTADWAGLATPRNLIEVSARLRSSQELDAQRSSDPLHRSGSSGGWSSLQLSRESSTRSRSGFSSVDSDGLSRPLSGAAADDGYCFECGDVIDTRVMLVDSFKGCTFVNQYVVVKTLGEGAYGKVKLCLNSEDHNLYALKLVNKGHSQRPRLPRRSLSGHSSASGASAAYSSVPEEREQQVAEISIMRNLCHPNIVRLMEVIDDARSNKVLLVMEYLEGGPVVLGEGHDGHSRMSEAIARKFFRDAVQGVDYLHSMGVAHGDIKPDNLLLGADGRVRICDFGSAQLAGPGECVLRTVGTPAFFTPEMCRGGPFSARAADLWALGVCLYIFVFGVLPFRAEAIMRLYDEIREAPLRMPRGAAVSPALAQLLFAMLAKDPVQRPSMAQIMAHPWVTHSGAAPMRCLQSKAAYPESEETGDGLDSLVAMLSPLFEERCYTRGGMLAREGDPADTLFYIEEGEAEICFSIKQRADEDLIESEESSDSDVELSPTMVASPHAQHIMAHSPSAPTMADWDGADARAAEIMHAGSAPLMHHHGHHRVRRHDGLLPTMLRAAARASDTVSSARASGTTKQVVTTTRGPGQFIGEVSLFEGHSGDAQWKTCVRARGSLKALLLTRGHLRTLLQRAPEAEAAVRAAMAQRKGELLKLETLERLASLYGDLHQQAAFAKSSG